jgi:hypothetical protein
MSPAGACDRCAMLHEGANRKGSAVQVEVFRAALYEMRAQS